MDIRILRVPPLGTNCYFISADGHLGLVDPGGAADSIIRLVEESGLLPQCIILTHGHFDHAGAAGALRAHFGIPVFIHRLDAPMLENAKASHADRFGFPYEGFAADRLLEDGDTVSIGPLPFSVLHTPGHTAGSICLLHENMLFSGDTLFCGSVGRFEREEKNAMQSSIRRLLSLPDETRVFPGHDRETTILQEKCTNPFANFNWEWE